MLDFRGRPTLIKFFLQVYIILVFLVLCDEYNQQDREDPAWRMTSMEWHKRQKYHLVSYS